MDFLTLFAIYVVVVVTCIVLVCKYSGQQQTPFSILFNSVGKVRKVEKRVTLLAIPVTNAEWHCYDTVDCNAKTISFLFFFCIGDCAINAKMAAKPFTTHFAQTVSSKVCP